MLVIQGQPQSLLYPDLRVGIILTCAVAILIGLGTLTPLNQRVDLPGSDKWHHFIAFAAFTYSLTLASRRHWILIIVVGLSFGGLIETIQSYINRSSDFYDFTADAFGVWIGFSLGVVVRNLKLKTSVWDGS